MRVAWLVLWAATASMAVAAPPSRTSRTARASWYHLPGRTMANGEPYRGERSTFASRHLPFGTRVEFTYRGRKVEAVCTDRGPFVAGRTFDFNRGLARKLGFSGVGTVHYRLLEYKACQPSRSRAASRKRGATHTSTRTAGTSRGKNTGSGSGTRTPRKKS